MDYAQISMTKRTLRDFFQFWAKIVHYGNTDCGDFKEGIQIRKETTNVLLNSYSSMKKIRKVLMIFDIENGL